MYKVEVWKRNLYSFTEEPKIHTEYDFSSIEEAKKYISEVKQDNREYFIVDNDGNIVT